MRYLCGTNEQRTTRNKVIVNLFFYDFEPNLSSAPFCQDLKFKYVPSTGMIHTTYLFDCAEILLIP